MPQTQFTLIYYYIPEDLDDLNQLNAFVIKKKIEQIKLPDIVNEFPIMGSYHFRFRCAVKKSTVWLDLMNPTCPLPRHQQKIVMKVTRVSWDQDKKRDYIKSQSIPMQRISSTSSASAQKQSSPIKFQQYQQPKPQQASQNLLHDDDLVQEFKNNNNNNNSAGFNNNNNNNSHTFNNSVVDNNAQSQQPQMVVNGNNMFGAAAAAPAQSNNLMNQDLLKLESTSPQIKAQSNKQFSILTPLEGLSFN